MPDEYPGERLAVSRNLFLAKKQTKTREELLIVTEEDLKQIRVSIEAGRLKE